MIVLGRFVIWWFGCLAMCSSAWSESKQFTVLHSNDIYGQLVRRGGLGGGGTGAVETKFETPEGLE